MVTNRRQKQHCRRETLLSVSYMGNALRRAGKRNRPEEVSRWLGFVERPLQVVEQLLHMICFPRVFSLVGRDNQSALQDRSDANIFDLDFSAAFHLLLVRFMKECDLQS